MMQWRGASLVAVLAALILSAQAVTAADTSAVEEEALAFIAADAGSAAATLDAAAARKAAARAEAAYAERVDRAIASVRNAVIAAEAWRWEQATVLYANVTDAELDAAVRWKRYAAPDAPERTCAVVGAVSPEVLDDIALLARAAAALPAPGNGSRTAYLALHAYHTTGIEGSALSLLDTRKTVEGQRLFADPRVMPTPAAERSAIEVINVARLWGGCARPGCAARAPRAAAARHRSPERRCGGP